MTPEVPKEVIKELRLVYIYKAVDMKELIYVPCNVVSWMQPSVTRIWKVRRRRLDAPAIATGMAGKERE